ncbi:hypothetical protein ACQKL6_15050 [Peribacillus sp. NPDC097197]|uniref:hypothetical protein n=1 Tax=Peribacillus sp. NPDC097197 TaxID=3390615 RepID=UPI003CFEB3B5
MFIAYTDASVKENSAYLAFVIEFEDQSIISRRILINESDNNLAEALALSELTAFLEYYNFNNGIILFDSRVVKQALSNKESKYHKKILWNVVSSWRKLGIKTQLISRKENIAHSVSYKGKYISSPRITTIDRQIFSAIENYPDYHLSLPVYFYLKRINQKRTNFNDAIRQLNQKIWLGELVSETKTKRVYAYYHKRITVSEEYIINISTVNYVELKHHWQVIRKKRQLKKHRRRLRKVKMIAK